MRTVAFVSRKGGSGKSTLAAHLAIGAALRGRKVLLADTDPQRSTFEVLRLRARAPDCEATTGAKLYTLKANAERAGYDLLVIDTQAAHDESMAQAFAACDQAMLVVRPSFLDFSAAARTWEMARGLRRPTLAVLNQAPPTREGCESDPVKEAVRALEALKLPTFPVIVRYRLAYQTALAKGLSVEELPTAGAARLEMATLADMTDRIWFPRPYPEPAFAAASLHAAE